MFRIIRWLCFPIARSLGWWPIAVYYALVIPLIVVRRIVYPLPLEAVEQMPEWLFPAIYAFVLVGFPLLVWLRNREWYRVQERS